MVLVNFSGCEIFYDEAIEERERSEKKEQIPVPCILPMPIRAYLSMSI